MISILFSSLVLSGCIAPRKWEMSSEGKGSSTYFDGKIDYLHLSFSLTYYIPIVHHQIRFWVHAHVTDNATGLTTSE